MRTLVISPQVFLLSLAMVTVRAADPSIVEARVQAIEAGADASSLAARLVVTRVYSGPSGLVGRGFLVPTSDNGHGGAHAIIRPALRVGENGLWALRETDGRLAPVSSDFRSRSWPVIEGRELDFGSLRRELWVERELDSSPATVKTER